MFVKIFRTETKKPLRILEFKKPFSVDPAGLAPASLRANGNMLHIYTTGPDPQYYYKTKRAPLKELFV